MSNNFTPRRLAVILAGVGLVASACTTGGEETTPTTGEESTDSTITGDDYTIAYESPDADDFNKLLESQEGLTNTQPVEILNLTTATRER